MTPEASPGPTLVLTGSTARALYGRHQAHDLRGRLAKRLVCEAEAMGRLPLPAPVYEGRRLLDTSRTVLRRVVTIAMAWHLTGDPTHVAAAARTMRAAAAFDSWNPDHFLDVAEMTTGLALGLDWLRGVLDPSDTVAIRDAIVRLGLRPGAAGGWWVEADNNWNQVCHCGLVLGALVAGDADPALGEAMITRALAKAHHGLGVYAPDGAYPEGPVYWNYGTVFTAMMIDALEETRGDAGGLFDLPGVAASGDYRLQVTGPSGLGFTYADGGRMPATDVDEALFWYAHRLRRPGLARMQRRSLEALLAAPLQPDGHRNRLLPLLLVWDTALGAAPSSEVMPRSYTAAGPVPLVVHRSGWTDDATWVAVKGGSPSTNHAHMDVGSFVVEAAGRRWVEDLGGEHYHHLEAAGLGIWNRAQDSDRWTILRHHNRAHATLTVDGLPQVVAGHGAIMHAVCDGAERCAVLDLGPVYTEQLAYARRGVLLTAGGDVIVRDEFRAKAGRQVRAGLPTRAHAVAVDARTLRLEDDGVGVYLRIDAPQSARWVVEELQPERACENQNVGFRLAAVDLTADGADQVLQVALLRSDVGAAARDEPLAAWCVSRPCCPQ